MEKLKSKSAKSKKHKSKIKGEKRWKKEKQKGGKTEQKWKNGLVHLLFFCFFDLLFVCFFFAFILLFSRQKAKKSKIKAKQKQKKADRKSKKKKQQTCKWTSPFFPCFSFLPLHFFPFILLPVFFDFEVLLFDFPCVFLFFFAFFQV